MPKIFRTEAISLHSVPFAESSKIVTFYTRDFGKIRFLAKGARRPKSKFGAALETFTYAKLIIYKPERPKLYIVSDAEIIRSFAEFQTSTEHYYAGMQVIGFVLKAVASEMPDGRLFNLILKTLAMLACTKDTDSLNNLVFAFYLKAASLLGYRPELDNCVACRKKLIKLPSPKIFFALDKGGILCQDCQAKSTVGETILYPELIYLKSLLYSPLKSSLVCNLNQKLKELIHQYLNYHFALPAK